jgi:hypothetical protein
MSVKKISNEMQELEKTSTKYIPNDNYYIVKIIIDSQQNDLLNVIETTLKLTDPQPLAIFYSSNNIAIIFSCVEDNHIHQLEGDNSLIVSKYVLYFSRILSNNIDICAKIIHFETQTQLCCYISYLIHQTSQELMIILSKGTITSKELQFRTEAELKIILEKQGINWQEYDVTKKYGIILKLKRKNKKIIIEKMSEKFDAREFSRYKNFIFG